MSVLGTVRAVDRANQVASVQVDGIATPVTVPYLGDAPCPLTRCELERTGRGAYLCLGSLGDSRVVIHDDFLTVTSGGNYGDTPWTLDGTLGTVVQGSSGIGSALITPAATAYAPVALRKSGGTVNMPTAGALWYSTQVTLSTATNVQCFIGLFEFLTTTGFTPQASGLVSQGCWFCFDSAATSGLNGATITPGWQGVCANGFALGTTERRQTNITALSAVLDLVLLPGGFCAWWASPTTAASPPDGLSHADGPYYTKRLVPTTLATMNLVMILEGRDTSQPTLSVDWVHLEEVTSVVDPSNLPVGTLGQAPAPLAPLVLNQAGADVLGTNVLG